MCNRKVEIVDDMMLVYLAVNILHIEYRVSDIKKKELNEKKFTFLNKLLNTDIFFSIFFSKGH